MTTNSKYWSIINWLFGAIFCITGILNIIYVDPRPGIFYIVLAFLYYPPIEVLTKQKLGYALPNWLKTIIWLLIMWATLAVGDLAELGGL